MQTRRRTQQALVESTKLKTEHEQKCDLLGWRNLYDAAREITGVSTEQCEAFVAAENKGGKKKNKKRGRMAAVKVALDEHILSSDLADYRDFVREFEEAGGDEQYVEARGGEEMFFSPTRLIDAYVLAKKLVDEPARETQPSVDFRDI